MENLDQDPAGKDQSAPMTEYRSQGGGSRFSSSNDDSCDSDDNDRTWKKVKRRYSQPTSNSQMDTSFHEMPTNPNLNDKRFNVWASVLQEQAVTDKLHTMDVIHTNSDVTNYRESESYNYLKNKGEDHKDRVNKLLRMGRKRTCADRKERLKMLIKSRLGYKVSEDDTNEKVTAAIVAILREPKDQLISRIVNTIGSKKALEFLEATECIEESGGILTFDGSRRRTPGGVYFYLVKNSQLTAEEKHTIFEEDNKVLEIFRKKAKARKRREKINEKKAALEADLKKLPTRADLLMETTIDQSDASSSKIQIEPLESDSSRESEADFQKLPTQADLLTEMTEDQTEHQNDESFSKIKMESLESDSSRESGEIDSDDDN